jgi:hypothetical protein
MNTSDLEFFKQNGYVSLGKVLSDEDVNHYTAQYDRDRSEFSYMWRGYGHHQSINCDTGIGCMMIGIPFVCLISKSCYI